MSSGGYLNGVYLNFSGTFELLFLGAELTDWAVFGVVLKRRVGTRVRHI